MATKKRMATYENADGHILPLEATEDQVRDLEALIDDELSEDNVDCANAVIYKQADGGYQIEWKGAGHQVSNAETLTDAEMMDILRQFDRGD